MKLLRFILVWCCMLLLPGLVTAVTAWRYQESPQEYEDMTMETYENALAKALQREKVAKEQIAQEQALLESLKHQLNEMDQRIAAVLREKYDILGITEQDVIDAENEIASIRQELESLFGLIPEELLKRANDIKKQETRIAVLKEKPISYLWRIRDQIRELDDLLKRVKANLPDKLFRYTVKSTPDKRECLSRIAQYSDVYNDPTQWPKIYRANKAIIDSEFKRYKNKTGNQKYLRPEDLIFPGQVFDIPR